ncbi:MAG: SRPBCC family protein [Sphingomicrobium sp.]
MDKIEQNISLSVPLERVWRAVSDHREFGTWFKVTLDQPFVAGQASTGHMTNKGYEQVRWNALVDAVEPPYRLAFRWHPYAIEPGRDYSNEPTTLVEIMLEADGDGTRLRVVESGFDALPYSRRDEAFRMNSNGWAKQLENIRDYLAAS